MSLKPTYIQLSVSEFTAHQIDRQLSLFAWETALNQAVSQVSNDASNSLKIVFTQCSVYPEPAYIQILFKILAQHPEIKELVLPPHIVSQSNIQFWDVLCEEISQNTTLTSFVIDALFDAPALNEETDINPERFSKLINALMASSVTEINLSHLATYLSFSPEDKGRMDILVTALSLPQKSRLTKFVFQNNVGLFTGNEEKLAGLAMALSKHPLTHLDLSQNLICSKDVNIRQNAVSFLTILSQNTQLQFLGLGDSCFNLQNKPELTALGKALGQFGQLKHLYLPYVTLHETRTENWTAFLTKLSYNKSLEMIEFSKLRPGMTDLSESQFLNPQYFLEWISLYPKDITIKIDEYLYKKSEVMARYEGVRRETFSVIYGRITPSEIEGFPRPAVGFSDYMQNLSGSSYSSTNEYETDSEMGSEVEGEKPVHFVSFRY